jgi:hypothetical protein
VTGFHLPGPWSAPERERVCERCGRPTPHYGRRVATAVDEESDRATGELAWFCNECGHKVDNPANADKAYPSAGDDLSELFDRH